MTLRMRPLRSFLIALALVFAHVLPVRALDVLGTVSGRWTADQSPVTVIGDCAIGPGTSLIVEPGVQVLLAPGVSISVDGTLTAIGTSGNPIRFEPLNPTAGPWRSIAINGSGQALMASCLVRGGGYCLSNEVSGVLRVDGGQLDLMSCEISGSASSGVLVRGGVFTAASTRFDQNGAIQPIDAGIHVIAGSVALADGAYGNSITNSVFGIYNSNIIPVTARNVWWGSASGPQHVTNVMGLGVSVSDDVFYNDWVTVNPFPMRGDVDRDGHVTVHDAAILLKISSGISPATINSLSLGDLSPNGRIDLADAQSVLGMVTHTISLP